MPFRRSYERFSVESPAVLFLGQDTGKEVFLKDLSSRGAAIFHHQPLEINQSVRIAIKEPFFADPLIKTAKVAWSKKISNQLWQSGLDFGIDNLIEFTS